MPKFVKGLALMGAAALLAGCAPTGVTAAVVNGVKVPQSRVSAIAEGCSTAINDSGMAQQQVTPRMLRADSIQIAVLSERSAQYSVEAAGMGDQLADGESAVDFLASHEVSGPGVPTQEELLAAVSAAHQEHLLDNEDCAVGLLGLVRHNLLAQNARTSYFGAPAEITLNPSYGTWDAKEMKADGSGSLSELAKAKG